jgi:capsule biosynthesis phosphatase
MKYVVDIDGTICNNTNGDYENAVPYQHAIDKVNRLYDNGHTVVYLTARGMGRTENDPQKASDMFRGITEKQLNQWGCKYHQLIMGKPSGDFYIDDKGINSEHFFS